MTNTMLFIGVSTGGSSAVRLFPKWAEARGIDANLVGVDLSVAAKRDEYRRTVSDLASDPSQFGALVTSHKVAIFEECRDMISEFTPAAQVLGEVGVLYKDSDGQLCADANDYFSTYQAVNALISTFAQWQSGCKQALILGCGGAGTALAHTLSTRTELGCTAVTILDVDTSRVKLLRDKVEQWQTPVSVDVREYDGIADAAVGSLCAGSLIVNATGLGKDRQGSPLTDNVSFPDQSMVWDINYRFVSQQSRTFLEQAADQRVDRDLALSDGWHYFLWGWTYAISRVFDLPDIPASFEAIAQSSRAETLR